MRICLATCRQLTHHVWTAAILGQLLVDIKFFFLRYEFVRVGLVGADQHEQNAPHEAENAEYVENGGPAAGEPVHAQVAAEWERHYVAHPGAGACHAG